MSLFDWFFPEQAQASHLRTLTEQNRRNRRTQNSQNRAVDDLANRVQALESDLGFVSLVLGSMMTKLDEKGTLTRDDIKAAMQEVDEVDGVADGKLDIRVLRGMQS